MKRTIDKEQTGVVILSQKDLLHIFPFGRTKLQQLLNAGVLPVVKIGKTYMSSEAMIERWLEENVGKSIHY